MRKLFYLLFLFSLYLGSVNAQMYKLTGNVYDNSTNSPLRYANIRVANSTIGTATNSEGKFTIRLIEGDHALVASYIGYNSDTITVNLKEPITINFRLNPTDVIIDEVTVVPGRNPAYDIIRKTIETKKKVLQKIEDYSFSAYTKGLIKTTRDFSEGGFSLSTQDTAKLKITGILENESRGFYKKPDYKKHFIVARKQTANTPPFINILTGGNLIQSFYEDELLFMGKLIPSPISEKTRNYYYYYIEKELVRDNNKIYQIYFNTDNPADPGFYGKLFIEDSSFHLVKVEARLNKMANPGGLFNYVKVLQQFTVFEDNISLPTDYRLFAEGNYLGLAKFGFELHTLMNSYDINTNIDDDIFDNAIISVLPEADKKNENYWRSIQSIPNTKEEVIAYSRIDSLTNVAHTFGEDFSILAPTLKLNNYFNISGPLSLYHFNKVEGNTLNFDIYYNDGENQRLNISSGFSYGFADKRTKKYFGLNYLLGDYRTTEFEFNIYDKLNDLFGISESYNKFTSTILSLFTHYDFRDYYYSKGFETYLTSEIFPILSLGVGYKSITDKTAINRSNFSFFYNDKNYKKNKPIYNVNVSGVEASFKIDFRKYIEDGFFRRRITPRNNIRFNGSIFMSDKKWFSSDLDFSLITLSAIGRIATAGNWRLNFFAEKFFSNGTLPFQWLNAMPGNINAAGKNNSFRTLSIGEVFGDNTTTIFLNHNFNDDLFKLLNIPALNELQIQFSTYLNIALSDISKKNKKILPVSYKNFSKPFYEMGFSLGHLLIPLKFEFTWKLNYRGRNNFVFGINSLAI